MKKTTLLILSIAILMCLFACELQGEHIHQFGEWFVIKNPSFSEDGLKTRYCSCGEKQSEIIPATGSDFVDLITVEDGYLVVNGVKTEYKVDDEPVISVIDGYIAINGIKTEYMVAADCNHIWNTVTTFPTCTSGGYDEMICKLCDKRVITNETDKIDHTYGSNYSFDDNYHWFICTSCGNAMNKELHNLNVNNNCTVCHIPFSATPGIVYDVSLDGTYAEVIGYSGTATKIKIADEYNGLPVKVICDKAFFSNQIITSVILPNTITTIGDCCFFSCSSLTSIVLGENIQTIGNQAFDYTKLETFHLPNSLENVYFGSIMGGVSSITSITVNEDHPSYTSVDGNLYSKDKTILVKYACGKKDSVFTISDDVLEIGSSAFENAKNITTVIIPEGVTTIGTSAFQNCNNLQNIIIPNSIICIKENAFISCGKIIYTEYENGKYLGNNENPYLALVGVTNDKYTSYKIHENTKIISGAFKECSRLGYLVVPNGVIYIGGYFTFFECSNFTDIYFVGSKDEWDAINESVPRNVTIHYNYNPEE